MIKKVNNIQMKLLMKKAKAEAKAKEDKRFLDIICINAKK